MRKDTVATRKRIIDTAEKLFAEKGVEATSLLDIARASGQKNRSALLIANKADDGSHDAGAAEFHRLGFGEPMCMSALHARGKHALLERIVEVVGPLEGERSSNLDRVTPGSTPKPGAGVRGS